MGKVLKRGAESLIILDKYEGQDAIIKKRIKKSYRLPELDERLRTERTRRESKLLREARSLGIPTPQVFKVDEEESTIYMQYIRGKRIKDVIEKMKKPEIRRIFEKIGFMIGKMHASGIVHGDLTTSNMILCDEKVYFIDFGLGAFSKRIEDYGTDLKLLKESIESTHPKLLNLCWKSIVNGYKKAFDKAEEVLKKVDEIEKRGRYVNRKGKKR